MKKVKHTIPELIILVFCFVSLMGLHLRYTPWLLASKPISALEYHDLDNEPAPDYARSFAINHGSAKYYRDGMPSEHPIKTAVIISAILGLLAVFFVIHFRVKRREKDAT